MQVGVEGNSSYVLYCTLCVALKIGACIFLAANAWMKVKVFAMAPTALLGQHNLRFHIEP